MAGARTTAGTFFLGQLVTLCSGGFTSRPYEGVATNR